MEGLPPWLREHIESVASATEASRDMALLLGLTAISTAVANKGRVVVKEGYTEPLQIWTASVAPPGARKSPIFSHMMRPIKDYEAEEEARYREDLWESQDERDILTAAIKAAKKDAKDVLRKGDHEGFRDAMREVQQLSERLQETTIPVADVITVADVTPERVGQLMAEHFGRAAIVSPEGDIFNIMAGLYSDGRLNLQVFKKGWTGNEAIADDRISREGTRVERPALVVGVTIQPVVLSSLSGKRQFRGEGLLGRFLYAQPEDRIGYRQTGDDVPALDVGARDRYAECLWSLLEAAPADEDQKGWVPHELPLSPEAADLRNEFAAEVERSLRPGEDLNGIEDWGAKLVGNVVRLAGLIHLGWRVQEEEALWSHTLTDQSMETAVRLGRSLIPHARRLFDEMELDSDLSLARYVLRRITSYEGEEPLTKRDLHRRCQGRHEIERVNDLERALKRLQEHNLIRIVERRSSAGRPPSPIIELHPEVREQSDKSDTSETEPAHTGSTSGTSAAAD